MKLRLMLASVLAIVALSGCEELFEEGNMQPDGSRPDLAIDNPTNNQVVTQAQGLNIKLTVVDKDAVKNLEFIVKGNESHLLTFNKVSDKNVVVLDTVVALDNLTTGTYQLFVRATDGRTNVSEKQVNFTVK